MKKIFIGIILTCLIFCCQEAFCADDFTISSDKGEIVSVEITPDIIYPGEEIKVEATLWNTSDWTWTMGDYFFEVEIYDKHKDYIEKTKRQIGKLTIPAKASEIVLLRLKTPDHGEYYAKVTLTLRPDITNDGKEIIQSSYYNFHVRAKESKIKFSGNVITEVENVKIKGDKSGPYVTEGGNIVSDATVRLDSALPGDAKLESLISFKYTDDDLIDKDPLSIEEFYLKYLSEKLDVTLGDLYAEFTDLTLNESLEGLSALVKSEKFNVTAVGARQWQPENDQQYLRYVAGIRPQFNIIKENEGLISDFDIGINYVTTQDDSGTLESEHKTDVSDLDNRVYSIDTNVKLRNNWKIYSEYAKSRNDANREDGTPCDKDSAFKLETRYKNKKTGFTGSYKKTGSNFESAVGFAISDREEYKLRGSYRFSNRLSILPGFQIYHDNLDNSKSTKTTTRIPKILLRIKPIEDLKDLRLDLSYRERDRKAEDKTRDEEWRTYKIGLRHKIKNVRLSLSQQLRKRKDFVTSANYEDTDTTSLGLGTNFEIADMRFSPSLNYRREKKDKIRADSKDIRESASCSLNCGLTDNTDLYLYTSVFDSDRNGLDYDSDRTTHEIKFSHRIRGSYDRMVSAGFKKVQYNYADAARDYELTRAFARMEVRF